MQGVTHLRWCVEAPWDRRLPGNVDLDLQKHFGVRARVHDEVGQDRFLVGQDRRAEARADGREEAHETLVGPVLQDEVLECQEHGLVDDGLEEARVVRNECAEGLCGSAMRDLDWSTGLPQSVT